jgi:hypothetical protein
MPEPTAYLTQVLVMIAKACRPNSPVAGRDWADVQPRGAPIRGFKAALAALAHSGLIHRQGWRVKPTPLGYELVDRWREAETAMRRRPLLWAPVRPDPESAFADVGEIIGDNFPQIGGLPI